MLTFAIETPARKVRVNGAERRFMRLSGVVLCSGGLSRWRISDTEDVVSFSVAFFFLFSAHFCASFVFFSSLKPWHHQFLKHSWMQFCRKHSKYFITSYRRHNETTDAKLKHGSDTDCSGCHGNTHNSSFRVIWILGVFPGKFHKKKKKKACQSD